MNKHKPLDVPFDVTYTISFSGRTRSDGIKTITGQMIRDKILNLLEEMIRDGHIKEYRVSAMSNNIEQAKETLKRSVE